MDEVPEEVEAKEAAAAQNWARKNWRFILILAVCAMGGPQQARQLFLSIVGGAEVHASAGEMDVREVVKAELHDQLEPLQAQLVQLQKDEADTNRQVAYINGRLASAAHGQVLAANPRGN